MIVLPTMHKRIRRSFLRLVLLFGALGVLMVTGITIAGRVPSELIRMNYDSIAYAQEMVRAMNGIRFPELYRDTDTLGWEKRFADTLEQASGNITEEAERKVITDLQASWDAYRQTPYSHASSLRLSAPWRIAENASCTRCTSSLSMSTRSTIPPTLRCLGSCVSLMV